MFVRQTCGRMGTPNTDPAWPCQTSSSKRCLYERQDAGWRWEKLSQVHSDPKILFKAVRKICLSFFLIFLTNSIDWEQRPSRVWKTIKPLTSQTIRERNPQSYVRPKQIKKWSFGSECSTHRRKLKTRWAAFLRTSALRERPCVSDPLRSKIAVPCTSLARFDIAGRRSPAPFFFYTSVRLLTRGHKHR